jgi:hypothetical protein
MPPTFEQSSELSRHWRARVVQSESVRSPS